MENNLISKEAEIETLGNQEVETGSISDKILCSQKTVAKSVSCSGLGLHSGVKVNMTINPAPTGFGIAFRRTDVGNFDNIINARFSNVTKTQLGTSLSNQDGTLISTVEHLMAALWGCGIDNALIEVDNAEIPIMDGSSKVFVDILKTAGIKDQIEQRKVLRVKKEVRVDDGDKYAIATPSNGFSIDLEIDFATRAIANQKMIFSSDSAEFNSDLADARTFGFEHEVEYMRKNGLARGGSLDNAIVISGDKVLNKDGLRYQDEFVRHKILDCIGDFYLAGKRIAANFKAYKSGHGLNNKLLHKIFSDKQYYEII
jgi:UDP-3-O-[3-hydroxymyristoyl] N-acetylglucosamine deacetylase